MLLRSANVYRQIYTPLNAQNYSLEDAGRKNFTTFKVLWKVSKSYMFRQQGAILGESSRKKRMQAQHANLSIVVEESLSLIEAMPLCCNDIAVFITA